MSTLPHVPNRVPPALPEYPKKQMAAGAVFFNAAGEVLLVKPTYRDHWSIPGGVIEDEESPRQGCIREVREELGLDVPITQLLVLDYTSLATGPRESLQFLFYGGILDEARIARIVLPPAELSHFRFVSTEIALSQLIPRIARRFPFALEAIKSGNVHYLEDGAPISTRQDHQHP